MERYIKTKEEKQYEQNLIKQHFRIIDYAKYMGFTVRKIGRYYTLKEHDSVRIDDERNCFWRNSTGSSGSVIDFAVEFGNMSVDSAIRYFVDQMKHCDYSHLDYQPITSMQKKKGDFVLPKQNNMMRNVYAYLKLNRCIDERIINFFVKNKMLYQDVHNNCVFVGYDDMHIPVFASKRGTLSDIRYVGDVSGSDYDWCIYIDNQSDKVIVTESTIDAMSIMTYMVRSGQDVTLYDYLVLSSTNKYNSLFFHLKRKKLRQIIIAVDNDYAGGKASLEIQQKLSKMSFQWDVWTPKKKDWNDDLKEGIYHAFCRET